MENRVKVDKTMERVSVEFPFWTGLMHCGGCSVGGTIKARLTSNELAKLKSVVKEYGTDSDSFEGHMPKLYARLLKMSYTAFDIQMAKEMYADYACICKEQFKGLSYSQRIAYIRKDRDTSVSLEDLFKLSVEIPENL